MLPHCQVDLVISEREGPEFGYAPGQKQRVAIRVGLPLSAADGGSGGGPDGQGSWNGKVRNLGGGALVGSIASTAVLPATQARYVGSFTDSGHEGMDPAFGVIQESNELNRGTIEDFYSESLRLQYQWALKLTDIYYGRPAGRNYFEGCSTGGRQALVLAQKHGNDFDGFLVGAPFAHQSRTSSAITWRVWLNFEKTGTGTVTAAKTTATVQRMVAACDGQDGLVDGLLTNPRTCKASAAINICGTPGAAAAGSCLTAVEAEAVDLAFDGPRNDLGHRVWVSPGRGAAMSMAPIGTSGIGAFGIYAWAQRDMNYSYRDRPLTEWDDLHQLVTTTVGPVLDVHSTNLDLVKNSGAKILMWHGLADPDMPWPQNAYFYDRVIDDYGGEENVQPWFRFFLAPGVTHCGGGVGPQPQALFDTLVNWAENEVTPTSILSAGTVPNTSPAQIRMRPLCPYPQMAIYNGGDPNAASSFSCGGNLHTKESRCDQLVVKYQQETTAKYESVGGVNAVSCGFQVAPVTTATLLPAAVNGWYINPRVTLSVTDQDSAVERMEYRLDGAGTWTPYTGPFQVTGDGAHTLEYRSVDADDNVEGGRALSFKIDATPPAITGLPAGCTIWPPNGNLVPVATVAASDSGSGVATGAPVHTGHRH